jgi:putative nucleotidyltransferase with HDIG domain
MIMSDSAIEEVDREEPAAKDAGAPWRVLFVGADAAWFGQIKRDLTCLHPDWLCLHAPVVEAPETAEWRSANALVVDGTVAGARAWLETIKKERANVNCVIRCDDAEKTVADALSGLGFPTLARQSDASALASCLRRNARLLEWRADAALQRLLPSLRKLPATPRLFIRVSEELRSPNGSLAVVALLIRQDPVMYAKTLHLANSAYFGLNREVSDMLDAATILGTERIKSLILLTGVFSQYQEAEGVSPSVDALLAHSIQVGMYARSIAMSETRDAATAEAAFTAGVLHDMGKMILAGNLPSAYKGVRKLRDSKHLADYAAEVEVFGATHANVGACLLAAWGLPLGILEAVAWHHEPERSSESGFSLLAAVHAANVFAHQVEDRPAEVNQAYFEKIGLAGCCQRWREKLGLGEGTTA